MIERRRNIWGVLIGLTICISIWRISVQEPYMLAEYGYTNTNTPVGSVGPQISTFYQSELPSQQSQQIYGGKHLLARKVHDISDEESRLGIKNTTPHTDYNSNTERAQSTQHTTQTNATKQTATLKQPLTAANSSPSQIVLRLDESYNKEKNNNTKSATKVKSSSNSNTSDSSSGKLSLVTSVNQTSLTHHNSPEERHNQHQATPAIKTNNSNTIETLRWHLPPEDPHQLIDLHNFDYIMNQPACLDNVAALILVHTAPGNYIKRLLIRKTWGQYPQVEDTPLRLIFLLGAASNRSVQYQLEQENHIFGDMVQGNFLDTYRNLTYKHAMVLKWFTYNCAKAQILIKMDDDVFLNTPLLLKYLQEQQASIDNDEGFMGRATHTPKATLDASQNVPELSKNSSFSPSLQLFRHPQNLLFCKPMMRALVKRSYRSKWRVSKREYSNRYYPPYCPGHFIIYSGDVVGRLYKAAQSSKYFWIDDVHVTGTLAQLENITITTSEPFMLNATVAEALLNGKMKLSEVEFIFTWPEVTVQQIDELWMMLAISSAKEIENYKNDIENTNRNELVAPHSYDGFR